MSNSDPNNTAGASNPSDPMSIAHVIHPTDQTPGVPAHAQNTRPPNTPRPSEIVAGGATTDATGRGTSGHGSEPISTGRRPISQEGYSHLCPSPLTQSSIPPIPESRPGGWSEKALPWAQQQFSKLDPSDQSEILAWGAGSYVDSNTHGSRSLVLSESHASEGTDLSGQFGRHKSNRGADDSPQGK